VEQAIAVDRDLVTEHAAEAVPATPFPRKPR
jgi:hypothetical protein